MSIQSSLQQILKGYRQARQSEPNGKSSSMHRCFSELVKDLETATPLELDSDLHLAWSTGVGGWAYVPWLAIFHNDETHSTQKGVYCIYLFKEDMSGLYLTLNQGVTSAMDRTVTGDERFHKLHSRADSIRKLVPELAQAGFRLDNQIDLKSSSSLGKSYAHSTIAHKLYSSDKLPKDAELLQDLNALIHAYLAYIRQRHGD